MLWIVQNNLFNEDGYLKFVNALERLGCEYMVVKPVPFTNILLPCDFDSATQEIDEVSEPFIDNTQNIMVFGATTMTRVANARGWNPGTYHNDNFDFSIWRDGFGKENILNHDSIVGRVKDDFDLSNFSDTVFVRPIYDSKTFSGVVMSVDEFHNWKNSIKALGQEYEQYMEGIERLDENTVITVASTKIIYKEYRMFVVDGKVVTGSLYKIGDLVRADENVDEDVVLFTEQMVAKWQPAKAFVVDIAATIEGLKVIEINSINSAGFYAADAQKIIIALEEMENTHA